jgi:transposase InsO family protein
MCCGLALAVTKATDVAEMFIAAAQRHGTPASVLTDNGCIYTAAHRFEWKRTR